MTEVVKTSSVESQQTASAVATSVPATGHVKSSLAILFEVYSRLTDSDLENQKSSLELQRESIWKKNDIVNSIVSDITDIAKNQAAQTTLDAQASFVAGAMTMAAGAATFAMTGLSYGASTKLGNLKSEVETPPAARGLQEMAGSTNKSSLLNSRGRDAKGDALNTKNSYSEESGKLSKTTKAREDVLKKQIEALTPAERESFSKVLDTEIQNVQSKRMGYAQGLNNLFNSAAQMSNGGFGLAKATKQKDQGENEKDKKIHETAEDTLRGINQNYQSRADEAAQNIRSRDQLLQLASNLCKG